MLDLIGIFEKCLYVENSVEFRIIKDIIQKMVL